MNWKLAILLLIVPIVANSKEESMSLDASFESALVSQNRNIKIKPESDIYAWLLGTWDIRAIDFDLAEGKRESKGEWIFTRTLEGRAIQDVYIVPVRSERSESTPESGNRYGTTIRVYDPAIDAWHITWINPVRQAHNHLTGRKVGNEIIQDGKDDNGNLMRWIFRDITADSFRWTGELSTDGGKTWELGADFYGTRRK